MRQGSLSGSKWNSSHQPADPVYAKGAYSVCATCPPQQTFLLVSRLWIILFGNMIIAAAICSGAALTSGSQRLLCCFSPHLYEPFTHVLCNNDTEYRDPIEWCLTRLEISPLVRHLTPGEVANSQFAESRHLASRPAGCVHSRQYVCIFLRFLKLNFENSAAHAADFGRVSLSKY